MNVAACYFSYLLISIGLTVWVARTLHRSGRVFLVDAFHGNQELADSVNHLLVVGFYLINIGYIALALRTDSPMATLRQIIELESVKIGVVLLILGGMHFFNILVFAKMRGRAAARPTPPPFGPFAAAPPLPTQAPASQMPIAQAQPAQATRVGD